MAPQVPLYPANCTVDKPSCPPLPDLRPSSNFPSRAFHLCCGIGELGANPTTFLRLTSHSAVFLTRCRPNQYPCTSPSCAVLAATGYLHLLPLSPKLPQSRASLGKTPGPKSGFLTPASETTVFPSFALDHFISLCNRAPVGMII